ncbi:F-box domain-containing protein [Madurella fahalii]|uniref:F-box domain-containing protein n=1 Tax=Madurella fahalii TaxID=1157608 RepID=A0ABQ0G9H4_9PEZI
MATPSDDLAFPLAGLNIRDLHPASRRYLAERAARLNATQEEIEAAGIRPHADTIVRHMKKETPTHSSKRARLNDSTVRKIYLSRNLHANRVDKCEDYEGLDFEDEWQALLAEHGMQDADAALLEEFSQIARQRIRLLEQATAEWHAAEPAPRVDHFDLIGSLSSCIELITEVCNYLRPSDIVNLYCTCRDFHDVIDLHMRSSVFAWAKVMAPTSARIYSSPVYYRWFIPDPLGRPVTNVDQELSQPQPGQARMAGYPPLNDVQGEVRLVPGLRWLQMVVNRDIRVRDILATLARMGHRMPESSHLTLKKLWLIMDASTSRGRMLLMKNPDFFTNDDLYIAQLFMIKLVLAFNDPVFGPQSSLLMRLMMGQRSLSSLWALLRGKKYRTPAEIRELKLRYDVGPNDALVRSGMPLHGVDIYELGIIHFEGWGMGAEHLLRPDELVPLEAARRQLDLDTCIDEMIIYGHVDLRTGGSLVPSVEEMYMSDDELPRSQEDWTPLRHEAINGGCGNVPFAGNMWQPKHARKARWKTLTPEEKEMILREEKLDMDEAAEIDSARYKFQTAWAKLAAMIQHSLSTRRPRAQFTVLPPSLEDLAEQLDEFERQGQPRKSDDIDAMDVDADAPPRFSALPLPMQAQMAFGTVPVGSVYRPITGDQMRVALRGAMSSLGPSHMWGTEPQQQGQARDEEEDDRSSSSTSLSSISDTDLELEPIPASELQRMYVALRPSRPREQQPQDQQAEASSTGLPSSPSLVSNYPSSSSSFSSEENDGDEDEDEDEDEEMQDAEEEGENEPTHFGGHLAGLPSLADLTGLSTAPTIVIPRVSLPRAKPTAIMKMMMTTDDMLLDQANQVYPDFDADFDAERAQQPPTPESLAATSAPIDWNDFLHNPGTYGLQPERDEVPTTGLSEGEGGEDGGDWEGGVGGDGDESVMGHGQDEYGAEEEEEEEEEEEDEGGYEGPVVEHFALVQVAGQEAQDRFRYMPDEDFEEDYMTRKLRDWYRPW